MTERLIEFDVSESWEPPEPPPGRRLPSRRVLGWLLAAAILVSVTAGAPAARLDPVLSVSGVGNSQLAFGKDRVYVFSQGDAGQFAAYPLGGSRPLWKLDLGTAMAFPRALDSDLLVFDIQQTRPELQYENGRTQVRDGRTGRLIWQRTDGGVLAVTADLVIMADLELWAGDLSAGGRQFPERAMQALDRRTGRQLWSRTVADGVIWSRQFGSQYDTSGLVAEIDRDGQLRVSDLESDTERLNVRLGLSGPPAGLEVWDDVVVVRQYRLGAENAANAAETLRGPIIYRQWPQILSAFDLVTGQPRWRVEDRGYLTPCGEGYLCEYSELPPSIVDPLTGAVVFRSGGVGGYGFMVRGDRVITSPELAAGRLSGDSALFDLRTGKQIRSFEPWAVVGEDPERAVLVAHNNRQGVLTVGLLDVDTGNVAVVGRAPDWFGDPTCERSGEYIGCAGAGGVRVWRVSAEVARRAAGG